MKHLPCFPNQQTTQDNLQKTQKQKEMYSAPESNAVHNDSITAVLLRCQMQHPQKKAYKEGPSPQGGNNLQDTQKRRALERRPPHCRTKIKNSQAGSLHDMSSVSEDIFNITRMQCIVKCIAQCIAYFTLFRGYALSIRCKTVSYSNTYTKHPIENMFT